MKQDTSFSGPIQMHRPELPLQRYSMSSPASSSRLQRLQVFIAQDPDNLKLRKDAVREACDAGQWLVATQLIDDGLQAHPDEAELWAFRGFIYLHEQRYEDATRALMEALARGLGAPEIRYNLAFAHFMLKRHAEALEILTDPLVPQALPSALLLRARCLHHLGRREDAVADCNALLALLPDDADAHGVLSLLLHELNRDDEAAAHITAALAHDPQQLDAMLASASIQANARDYAIARHSFDTLLQAHPQCGRGWLGLALIELTEMQFDAAKRDIDLAATHMPEHIGTWHVLAWVELMRGDVAAAEAAFTHALALDRNFAETHGGLAVIAALQGREEDARMSMKRAQRLNPDAMAPLYAEIVLLQRHGKQKEAHAVLDGFLARPLPRSDLQYHDFITAQMRHLRLLAETGENAARH